MPPGGDVHGVPACAAAGAAALPEPQGGPRMLAPAKGPPAAAVPINAMTACPAMPVGGERHPKPQAAAAGPARKTFAEQGIPPPPGYVPPGTKPAFKVPPADIGRDAPPAKPWVAAALKWSPSAPPTK